MNKNIKLGLVPLLLAIFAALMGWGGVVWAAGSLSASPNPTTVGSVVAANACWSPAATVKLSWSGTACPSDSTSQAGILCGGLEINRNVTMTGVGSCTFVAHNQSCGICGGDKTVTVNVTKGNQTITVNTPAPASAVYGTTFNVAASVSPSGSAPWNLAVTATGSGGCSGSGTGTVTMTMISGTTPCTVTYTQAGDGNYNAATNTGLTSTTTATKKAQTISVTQAAPASEAYGNSFVVKATANSGLAVAVAGSNGCTGSGNGDGTTITMKSSGGQACTVSYTQVGDSNYSAAVALASTTKVKQTITVTTPAPAAADYDSSFSVAATASSALPVNITVSGGCSITSGGTSNATIKMTSGTTACTVSYEQAGDANFAAAPTLTPAVTANKLTQTITFPDQSTPSRVFVLNNTFAINPTATASSGLAISYSSVDTSKCTVAGTTVTMKGGGNCIIAADQSGNANYNAAARVTQTVKLTKQPQTITVTQHAPGTKPKGQSFTVKATASSGLAVSIQGMGNCSGSGTGTVTITMGAGSGLCSVMFTQAGNDNYEVADPVTEHVAVDDGGSGCFGEGTYTSLRFSNSGGYLGWACNDGDFIAPGHNISCWPPLYLPWIRPGWSIQPGSGLRGHVLQTQLNPGKTFKIQRAPGPGGYYNILNTTDATCLASGNGIYEWLGTRRGANSSAGYLVAIQDSATMPSGKYCDYSNPQTKWSINYGSGYATFGTAGYPSWPEGGCMGTDIFNLSRRLLDPGNGNYGHWGDSWVRNLAPSCSSSGARLTCGGYTPAPPDHIRFEFNAEAAYTCTGQGANVTIRVCKNAMPEIGSSGSCEVFEGYAALRPQASRGAWMGLTADPSTSFNGSSTGISLLHTVVGESVNLSYSNPSLTLANNTLECYDTKSNQRVSCTGAFTYKECPPFDAVEKGADPGTNLYTKLSGVPFEFDVATGNTAYTGNVTVELVDVSAGAAVCPDTGAKLTGVSFTQPAEAANSITHAYVAGDNGRKTFKAQFDNAVAKVAVRIKEGAHCYASSDQFTIRPTTLNLAMTPDSGTWKAGEALTLTATARIRLAGDGTATLYTGTPAIVDKEPILIHDWRDVPIHAGAFHGSFGAAVAGVATGVDFGYEGVGVLKFLMATGSGSAVGDSTYTTLSGDQGNADCVEDSYSNDVADDPDARGRYGCNIGSTALTDTPRFTPYHYDITHAFSPACVPADASKAFSYFGQAPAAPPVVKVQAKSKSGANVFNLFSEYPHKSSFTIVAQNGATPLATMPMALTTPFDWPSKDVGVTGGEYVNADTGLATRPAVIKPAAPPSYEALTLLTTVTDADGIKLGMTDADGNKYGKCNGNDVAAPTSSCASAETKLRFGVLKMDNAYGSELLPLYVPVTALYWNGTKWARNTEDSCTRLHVALNTTPAPATESSLAVGHYKAQLTSGEVSIKELQAPAPEAPMLRLTDGQASIRFEPPGAGKFGSAEVALNLNPAATPAASSCVNWASAPNTTAGADLTYLRGAWCNNTYDKDPHARITFGTPKSQFLYMRERY